jgi:hypothetical protein
LRRIAWLALLAAWLQVLAPVMHDAAMAATMSVGAGPSDFDPAHHLCLSPGAHPVDPGGPAKAPAHPLPACALCQAVHAANGFVPPATPAVGLARVAIAVYLPTFDASVSPRWSRTRQQPRAPPAPV